MGVDDPEPNKIRLRCQYPGNITGVVKIEMPVSSTVEELKQEISSRLEIPVNKVGA